MAHELLQAIKSFVLQLEGMPFDKDPIMEEAAKQADEIIDLVAEAAKVVVSLVKAVTNVVVKSIKFITSFFS